MMTMTRQCVDFLLFLFFLLLCFYLSMPPPSLSSFRYSLYGTLSSDHIPSVYFCFVLFLFIYLFICIPPSSRTPLPPSIHHSQRTNEHQNENYLYI